MNDCRPDIMTAVPRFYQNLYQKISSNFQKAKGVKKFLVNSTLDLEKNFFKRGIIHDRKIINFFCQKLVRKKLNLNLVEI